MVAGHLRDVKDPFLAARAAALVERDSRLRVLHVGAALEPRLAVQARREMECNPRYEWLGVQTRARTLATIGAAHVLLVTSRSEGGASVVAEAVRAGTPVLSTRNEGTLGMLGTDYAGWFEFDDARGLADLLRRCERAPDFLARLRDQVATLFERFSPRAERDAWAALLAELRDA